MSARQINVLDWHLIVPASLNSDALLLPKFRKAIAGVRTGAAFAKVACIGSSYTAGEGAGTGGNGIPGCRTKSFPAFLATLLNSYDILARNDSFFGSGGTGWLVQAPDTRLVSAAGWVEDVAALGGPCITNFATNTLTLAFTPIGSFDTFDIYYIQAASKGTFTVNVDGGATLATINSVGATSLQKATVSCALGIHTINIQRNGTGSNVSIIGVDAYNSATKDVHVWNFGWSGTSTSSWLANTNVWDPINALAFAAPHLSIMDLSSVEESASTPTATWVANTTTLVTALQAYSDVILTVTRPLGDGTTQATMDAYTVAIYAFAQANSLPLFDLSYLWTSYSNANSLGYMFDTLHSTAAGYADEAAACRRLLRSAL